MWVLSGLTITLASDDPVARALVLAAAWLLIARRHLSERRLRPLVLGVATLGGLTTLVNGLLSHTGASALVTLPSWLPLVGGTVTVEALAYGASIALSLMAAVSVTAALSLVIEATDLVDALPWFLARSGAAVGSALNLVPAMAAAVTSVRDAQRLRGWRPRGPRAVVDLAVPVLLGAIERSTQLAESMEARAFGSGTRTRCWRAPTSAANLAVGAGSLAVLGAFVAARALGLDRPWYPYPTLVTPSLAPAVLLPPLALAGLGLVLTKEPDGHAGQHGP